MRRVSPKIINEAEPTYRYMYKLQFLQNFLLFDGLTFVFAKLIETGLVIQHSTNGSNIFLIKRTKRRFGASFVVEFLMDHVEPR